MSVQPKLDRLKSQLLVSGLQQKDNPLFQVVNQLINSVEQSIGATGEAIESIGGDIATITI